METYKKLYQTLLEPFQEQLWSHELTSCPIIVGKDYEQSEFRLMYVGRAVNGWEFDWHKDTLDGLTNQVFSHGFDIGSITDNPVQPDGYNFNRSPFWQLCRSLLAMQDESDAWSSRVAWSNLFKVAPFKTGNPEPKTMVASIRPCIDLIKEEINVYNPSHIVFVTDSWWMEPADYTNESFAKELGIHLIPNSPNTVVGMGTYQNSKIVVTKRPETAKTSRVDHSKQILDALKSL